MNEPIVGKMFRSETSGNTLQLDSDWPSSAGSGARMFVRSDAASIAFYAGPDLCREIALALCPELGTGPTLDEVTDGRFESVETDVGRLNVVWDNIDARVSLLERALMDREES